MTEQFDLIVENGEVMTMDPSRSVFEGWIGIRDGRIAEVGIGETANVQASHRVNATGCLVRPGYIDAHHHSMDTLARASSSAPIPFADWLCGTYYSTVLELEPAEAAWSTTLVASELLKAGVTTVVDCWGVGDVGSLRSRECFAASAEAASRSGLRWILAPMVGDRLPAQWSADLERMAQNDPAFRPDGMIAPTDDALSFIADAISLAKRYDSVDVWAAPELPEMASDELLSGLSDLVRDSGGSMTTHLLASPDEPAGRVARSSVERLLESGAAKSHLLAAHLTFATDHDLSLLAQSSVGAAHCPSATMMLGGNRSVAGQILSTGIPVGLGLDNPSLNAGCDMAGEMRQALMFDRACSTIGAGVSTDSALAMATSGGAQAIAASHLGSIEVGKSADVVVVDRSATHWEPPRNAGLATCFQERPGDVRDVIVGGRPVVTDGVVRPLR